MAAALGIDPGERRTGVALADPTGTLASPLLTHDRRRDASLIDLIADLCREHAVTTVVVGHALTQSGERGESALRSERVAARLGERLGPLGIGVELFDERYSTAEAGRILAGSGSTREQRDALAAALILQAWLDAREGRRP